MEKNYYVCSVGDPENEHHYDKVNLTRCLENDCYVLNEYAKRKGPIENIKIGDIILLKSQKHLIAYGLASSTLQKDKDLSEGEDWSYRIEIKKWIQGTHSSIHGIESAQVGGTNYDAVKKVSEEFGLKKMKEIATP